jgi:hypothetical protein
MRPFALLLAMGAALLAAAPVEAHIVKACWLFKEGGLIDFWLYTYEDTHNAIVTNSLVFRYALACHSTCACRYGRGPRCAHAH